MLRTTLYMVAIGTASLALLVAPAWGHQIASNNGTAVQVHVDPNDEPIAGVATTVWVVRVKPLKATFAWATCRHVRSNGSRHARGAISWCTEFGPHVPGAYGRTGGGSTRR